MDSQRTRTGLAISAAGGVVTAISVYQPWYGIGITRAGLSFAEQAISSLPGVSQYAGAFGAAAGGAVGRTVASANGHQALTHISLALLAIAGAAVLVSIVGLAGATAEFPGDSAGPLAALGLIGVLLTLYRIVDPPNPMPEYFTLTLRYGAYTTLLGCAAIAAGALWPARGAGAGAGEDAAPDPASVWSELSGWTPS